MVIDFEQARFAMVEQQVRPYEVLDLRVLDAMSKVKREDFVPMRHRKLAFTDMALPLEHGEMMMKPTLEGRMLQALDLAPEDSVLEIGTGSGFITACLGHLARAVVSIDIHADFVERARVRFVGGEYANISVQQADVTRFEPGRQFDAVCFTGAVVDLPERAFSWLRPGGRLFAVRGLAPVQEAVRWLNQDGRIETLSLFETELPYLAGLSPVARFAL
ncbi:MAG: protein-L-isoaspartate O-methyltransferase [Xanthomonadaceae bacterium]|nr:protein-L-isoaspartate O-methyltransferase [Xanthomonadaceae bacterium]MDP2184727.1 protein-L-isoaspartate O-methyltransferase [Xanthomonadales bacterium]MDZ4116404.1 protein-L-isoaspartate O-methyltransferase [Xanthomonadaceae bacterium]MDZ4378448.1 protein-L-isoaspartate O-methyltransferase [Xanthomonadaceae bacterium]